jgi:hypothetical protein
MQIVYTLGKVTKRRIENLIFILIAAVLSLVLILFFCSFSNRLERELIGIADLVTCLLSIGLIWVVVAIFVTMFNRIRGISKESLSAVISKILASLFIGAFCLLTLIYGEFSKTITFNGDSFLSLVSEWLPYVGYYVLVGIAVVAYQTFKDWHLGQYIEYRIELYNKELLHGLSHFYLSSEIKRVPYISEMKKNIADIFVNQREMK